MTLRQIIDQTRFSCSCVSDEQTISFFYLILVILSMHLINCNYITIASIINYMKKQKKTFGVKEFRDKQHHQPLEDQIKQLEWILNLDKQFKALVERPIELRQTIFKNEEPQRCLIHNIIYSIYCSICRKPLCASCMYKSAIHRKHRVVPIENASELLKEDVKSFDPRITKIVTKSDQILKLNSECMIKLEKQYNPLVLKLEEFYESMQTYLKNKLKEQLAFLKDARECMRSQITSYSKGISKINNYLNEKFKNLGNILAKGDHVLLSRNVLESLLNAEVFVAAPQLYYENFSFEVELHKFKEMEEEIRFKLNSLIPTFQEKTHKIVSYLPKSSSLRRNTSQDKERTLSILKKPKEEDILKKRANSSVAVNKTFYRN